jgi:hypothetical protein
MCEYIGFELVILFIGQLWIVATCNCSAVANSYILKFTAANIKFSQFAVTSPVIVWQRLPTTLVPQIPCSRLRVLAESRLSHCNSRAELLPTTELSGWRPARNNRLIFWLLSHSSNELIRERRESWVGGVIETKFAVLKVLGQWPLVLLVEVRLVCGICSILIFLKVGITAMGRNVVWQWEGYIIYAAQRAISVPTQYLLWYQGKHWPSWPVAGPSGCKLTSGFVLIMTLRHGPHKNHRSQQSKSKLYYDRL